MSASASKTGQFGQGRPMLTGILIGLVAGVGLSAGVAVWVARMPSPFQNRALDNGSTLDVARPAATAAGAAAQAPASRSAGAGAPGADAPAAAAETAPAATAANAGTAAGSAAASAPPAGTPAAAGGGNAAAGAAASSLAVTRTLSPAATTWLQVGAFGTEEDAQKQVETVALLTGVRASVQAMQQSDKVLYRVRLGPYGQKGDYAELSDTLKSNGISATIIHTSGQ